MVCSDLLSRRLVGAPIDSRTDEDEPGIVTDLSMPHVHSYLPEDPVDVFWCMDVFDLDNDKLLVGCLAENGECAREQARET